MKKVLLTLFFGSAALLAGAQTCNELFFSEYVEGTNFNKALEIYNPTNAPIDLSNYRIVRWDNGSTVVASNEALPLPADMIPAKGVYVVVVNTSNAGQETEPDTALANKANVKLCTSCLQPPAYNGPRTMCFNGDDAISLQKNDGNGNWSNVDIFGLIGERPSNKDGNYSPGAGWTNMPPYYAIPDTMVNIPQRYFLYYWTQDKTLIRKSTVVNGVKQNPGLAYGVPNGAWNVSTEWDSLPVNTFSNVGIHACDCNTVGVTENTQTLSATVYPNPATDLVSVIISENIKNITVYNIAGQTMLNFKPSESSNIAKFNTNGLVAGMYIVRIETVKGHIAIKKVTIQ